MPSVVVGDCREVLAAMEPESAQCCVTSPPYFGLRDYQTGTWEGGDEACDHRAPSRFDYALNAGLGSTGAQTQASNAGSNGATQYRDRCGKCGAVRVDRQIGMEHSVDAYVAALVGVFREVRRILRPDGTLWLNLGDAFENKQLLGIPWRVALALQADGWYLRSDCIWHKPNPMPESVTDRPTRSHEYIFLLTKRATYFYDADAVREPHSAIPFGGKNKGYAASRKDHHMTSQSAVRQGDGRMGNHPSGRNRRTVWAIPTAPFSAKSLGFENVDHFATFPPALVEPCVKAGTSERGRCGACGSPWVRVVERERFDRSSDRLYGGTLGKNPTGTVPGSNTRGMPDPKTLTKGWAPSCSCDAGDPVPCVVFDPFSGSGTVGLVANRLGRDAVLIELNPAYAEIARRRIAHAAGPLFAGVDR